MKVWFLAFLALVLATGGVVAAVVVVVSKEMGQPGERTAAFLPGDAQLYLTINLRPGSGQIRRALHLDSIFNAVEGHEDKRDRLFDDLEDETGIDPRDDILPWLGKDVTVALSEVSTNTKPEVVALLHTTDRQASIHFLRDLTDYLGGVSDLATFREGSYADAIVFTQEEDEVSFGVTEEYVVITNGETPMKNTIDRLALPPVNPLSEDAAFIDAQTQLPEERFGFLFVRGGELLEQAQESLADVVLGTLESDPADIIAMSSSFLDDGMRLDVYAGSPLAQEGTTTVGQSAILEALPQDTLLVFSANLGLKDRWQDLRDALRDIDPAAVDELDSVLDEVMRETGVDLEEEIINQLVGEVALALLPSDFEIDDEGPLPGDFRALLLAELANRDEMARSLQTMIDNLPEDSGITVRRQKLGNYDATILDLAELAPDISEISSGYFLSNNLLTLGSTFDSLLAAAQAQDGDQPTLAVSPRLKGLMPLVRQDATFLAFADVGSIIQMVVPALSIDGRQQYQEEARPFLEPLDLFFATAWSTEGATRATLVMTVKE